MGENRWRAPQPAKSWDGVLYAHKFAPISMQQFPGQDPEDIYTREWNVDTSLEMSEDSLHLNIWTPAKNADEKLPVFVWYFGGGLQTGNTAEMEFDGERIARRGIIVVTINYRVNVFGFLCHPEITAENPDAPANFGLLDQQFGTRWVKRNIAAFGGDPDNITIGGQSAGGGSVLSQVTNLQNAGLFRKAIVESGFMKRVYQGTYAGLVKTLPQAELDGVAFFRYLGVSSLAEARRLDAFYIRDKAVDYGKLWFSVIDGIFCTDHGGDLLIENKRLQIPMMIGHTATEFHDLPEARSADEFRIFAKDLFGSDADAFLKLCASRTGSVTEMLHKASVSQFEFAMRLLAGSGAAAEGNAPVYYWVFNAEIPGWDNPGPFHSSDLWFFFETLAKCWRPFVGKHYDLARMMCNYWANFIRSGDPNGADADGADMPFWKPFTESDPGRMIFGDTAAFSSKGPDALMTFLTGCYLQSHKKDEI